MATFNINAAHVSRPRVVGKDNLVTIRPAAGATAIVEYTTGTSVDVMNNAATWRTWPKGNVTTATSDQMTNPGFIRVTAIGGSVSYEVAEQVSSVDASAFRADWQSAIGASGAPTLSGQFVVGGSVKAQMPPGVFATLQFTRTLKAPPYTKSALGAAIAGVNSATYSPILAGDAIYNIGCEASAQVASSPLAEIYVAPNNTPIDPGTLRQVATSTFINSFQHPANKQANSRSPHYMRAPTPSIQIVLSNWWVSGQTETNGSGTDTYKAALEYPAGTFTQITFNGGAASGVIAPGDNIISDPITAPPNGAKFWIRLNLVTTGLVKFQLYYAGDGTAQLEAAVSGLTDKTMGGSIATTASKDAGMIMPCAIIGISNTPAIGIPGDSISVGRGDTATADIPLQGHLGRSFGALYPSGHLGVSGDRVAAFLLSNTKRLALNQYFTHFAANFGINDVTNGATASQLQADTNSYIALFGAKPVAFCTMSPVSTGTWTTVAGQTTVASNPVRAATNTQRLTNFPLAKTVYDVNPVVENVTSPEDGLWNITGGANTDDGTHHNANSATRIAAAINPALLLA